MSGVSVIENKISAIRKYTKILKTYRAHSQARIEADYTLRGAVERYLYLAVQSSIDLAEALIAYKKLRKPATMGEAFDILAEAGVFDPVFARTMRQLAGFRNIIAYDYADLDYDILYDVLQHKLRDVDTLVARVSTYLKL